MGFQARQGWRRVAWLAALSAAALSVCTAVGAFELATGIWRTSSSIWVGAGVVATVLPLLLGLVSLTAWLAWRLWFRWDATTARAAVAAVIGVVLLWSSFGLLGVAERWSGRTGSDGTAPTAVVLVDLIVGALAYRRAARAVIRSAGLADPPDAYGMPLGHAGRARAFCVVLGWAVFLTAADVARLTGWDAPRKNGPGLADRAAVLGPMVLGWATYKVVMWRLSPRTRPAVPAGGFEVLPVTRPEHPVG